MMTEITIKQEDIYNTAIMEEDNGGEVDGNEPKCEVDEDEPKCDPSGCSKTTISESGIYKLRKQLLKKRSALERKKYDKQRKTLQMRRMRKWLVPKNPITVLNELQGSNKMEFVFQSVGNMAKAEVVINNVKYEATGSSKYHAKVKVCEKALRNLFISQMARVKQQQEAAAIASGQMMPPVPPPPSMSETESDGEASMLGSEMDVDKEQEPDDLPMEHLAAFALHKLFSEWAFFNPNSSVVSSVEESTVGRPTLPKVTKTVADLPPDAATRHPTALFAYMRPQVPFQDLGMNEDPLNPECAAAIDVDGMKFVGYGRSKKLARKAAAVDACKALFGVEFDSSVL